MTFIVWLIVGGLLGWIASMIMGTNDTQGKLLNVIVGIDSSSGRSTLACSPTCAQTEERPAGRGGSDVPVRGSIGRREQRAATHGRA